MKQIKVEKERCIGCGACVAIAPETFEFDEEGKSSVIENTNLENEQIKTAMESCPTAAIVELETGCDCENNCECESDCECDCDCDCQDGEECTCEDCTCQDFNENEENAE